MGIRSKQKEKLNKTNKAKTSMWNVTLMYGLRLHQQQ